MEVMLELERALEVSWTQLRNRGADKAAMPANFASPASFPEVSKGESLDQLKRQIAALFDVAADKVEIVIRT